MTPWNFLLVASGGAVGAVLRFVVSTLFASPVAVFPWGTLVVNVVGSGLIGLAAGLGVSGEWRLFLVTGVLGGFTTFSAFSLEAGVLWEKQWWLGVVYVGLTLVLGLGAFGVVWGVGRR